MRMETDEGVIEMRLRPDSAPETVSYVCKCVDSKLYDGRHFCAPCAHRNHSPFKKSHDDVSQGHS
eukprot:SAG31_NODE_787_length_12094_cov_27.048270_8_plen_65_part_00